VIKLALQQILPFLQNLAITQVSQTTAARLSRQL